MSAPVTYQNLRTFLTNPPRYILQQRGELDVPEMTDEQHLTVLLSSIYAEADVSAYYKVVDAPNKRVKAWTEAKAQACAEGMYPVLASQLETLHAMAASLRNNTRLEALRETEDLHVRLSETYTREDKPEDQELALPIRARATIAVPSHYTVIVRTVDKIENWASSYKFANWAFPACFAATAVRAQKAYVAIVEYAEPHCTVLVQCPLSEQQDIILQGLQRLAEYEAKNLFMKDMHQYVDLADAAD